MFFANFSLKNSSSSSSASSSSSPSTAGNSADSAKIRFSNVAKMHMKKNRFKHLKHPDSPLVQSAMALGKDKFSLRKYYNKTRTPSSQPTTQSPLVNVNPPTTEEATPTPLRQTSQTSHTSLTSHTDTNTTHPQTPHRYVSQTSSEDNFTLAPEAFQRDGTPVFDSNDAKMYYDEVKSKRNKMFRRQSTVSSLNSMSLDEIQEYYYDAVDDDTNSNSQSQNTTSSSIDSGYNSIILVPSGQDSISATTTIPDSSFVSQQQQQHIIANNNSLASKMGRGGNVDFQSLSQFEANTDQNNLMRTIGQPQRVEGNTKTPVNSNTPSVDDNAMV